MKSAKHDLVVIGGGPGGYVAALRAAQLGLDTACIEKEDALGGTCVRIGCIPSKALLEASHHYAAAAGKDLARFGVQVSGVELDLKKMMAHKDKVVKASTKGVDYLFDKNKVTRYQGHGQITGKKTVEVEGQDAVQIEAKHILIATGSQVTPLKGVELDGDRIGTSTEALSYGEVPEHLVLIGAGIIGLELGSVWSRLGAKVTVLEYLDRILPGIDLEIAKAAQKVFKKQGLDFHLGVQVTGARLEKAEKGEGGPCIVEAKDRDPIRCDRVLLAVGRKPNTEGLGLDAVGLETDDKGRIPVDEHFATEVEGIFAIGDVIRGPMLAHKAEEEGVACVEGIANGYGHVNYDAIPSVVYTHPEIAAVGKTEEELQEAGIDYKKGSFPFSANGRARAMNETDGLVKVLADAKTDRVLGVHILGPHAGDLIAEAVVAMEFGASSEDIARSSHAHPTLLEALKEAALGVEDQAIHI